MKKYTFKGGIYLNEETDNIRDKEIVKLFPGKELFYPIVGKVLVKEGERVLKGQMLSEASSVFDSVFSSVSGFVKSIKEISDLHGEPQECIIIENDERYELTNPYERVISKDINSSDTIEYVLFNLVESEPCFTSTYRLLLEQPKQLVQGMKELLSIYPNAKGIVGIEENHLECVHILQESIKDEPRIQMKVLKKKYPQYLKQPLIYALTKHKITYDMNPQEKGCMIYNVNELLFVQSLYVNKIPYTEQVITLCGEGVNEPGNYSIHVGMTYCDVVEKAGGAKEGAYNWISGGSMRGNTILWQDAPVEKNCNGILALPYKQDDILESHMCIRCGRCVEACPNKLMPCRLLTYAQIDKADKFMKWGGMECIDCGCCSYVCPSKIDLKKYIYEMKVLIRSTKDERAE